MNLHWASNWMEILILFLKINSIPFYSSEAIWQNRKVFFFGIKFLKFNLTVTMNSFQNHKSEWKWARSPFLFKEVRKLNEFTWGADVWPILNIDDKHYQGHHQQLIKRFNLNGSAPFATTSNPIRFYLCPCFEIPSTGKYISAFIQWDNISILICWTMGLPYLRKIGHINLTASFKCDSTWLRSSKKLFFFRILSRKSVWMHVPLL